MTDTVIVSAKHHNANPEVNSTCEASSGYCYSPESSEQDNSDESDYERDVLRASRRSANGNMPKAGTRQTNVRDNKLYKDMTERKRELHRAGSGDSSVRSRVRKDVAEGKINPYRHLFDPERGNTVDEIIEAAIEGALSKRDVRGKSRRAVKARHEREDAEDRERHQRSMEPALASGNFQPQK